MSKFQQFVAFGTDIVGLERTLRLVQSLAMMLLGYPMLLTAFHSALNTSLVSSPWSPTSSSKEPTTTASGDVTTSEALLALSLHVTTLRATMNLTRRYLRLFRFLDSLSSAQRQYRRAGTDTGPALLGLAVWLDVLRGTFLAAYGLLESATVLDLSGIPVLGSPRAPWLNVEAQRFWLAALCCGVAAGAIRVVDVAVETWHKPGPGGVGDGGGEGGEEKMGTRGGDDDEKTKKKEKKKKNRERKLEEEREQVEKESFDRKEEGEALMRKLAADVLDLTLPSAALGLIDVDPGFLGTVMLVSTLITSYDVWLRCGK